MGGGAGCKEVGFLKGGTKPCVQEIMRSIAVGDSDIFSLFHACVILISSLFTLLLSRRICIRFCK